MKVTNFRTYHRSGEPNNSDYCSPTTEMATQEELQRKTEEEKENSRRLQEDVELLKLQNTLEVEKMKQEQWQTAITKLKEAKQHATQEHSKCLEQMGQIASSTMKGTTSAMLDWFKAQLEAVTSHNKANPTLTEEEERNRRLQAEREEAISDLKKQQEEIQRKLKELEGITEEPHNSATQPVSQEVLLQQLRSALSGKKEEDPNKVLLKALITQQNKTVGEGGTSILKPGIMSRLTVGETANMAEWLASLNKQEEGESDITRFPLIGEEDGGARGGKTKSGMLDKATTNIQQKQVWPQQNLGEDWADKEVEFKQIKFEHLVAGETRTIETCSDPAEILGRLRLLRRVAYLKLRGYEWNLIRKMYAAILTSIETKEYSWESNFDRFETILYRKVIIENRPHQGDARQHTEREGRKRFCRDYNKEGCPRNSPHPVWIGNGSSAVKKMVYHYCAACLIRDKQQREHPEGHQDCPHRM